MSTPSIVARLNAAAELVGLGAEHQSVIGQWWQQLRANAGDAELSCAAAVSSAFDELTCFVSGAASVATPLVRDVMDATGATAGERALLDRARNKLGPKQLGTWLAAGSAGFDAGWYIDQRLGCEPVRTIVPASAAAGLVWDWADDVGATVCCQLRRSINADTPFTDVSLLLPPDRRNNAVDQACSLLGMEPFGDAVPGCVAEIDGVAVSVRLLEEGIGALALAVIAPPAAFSFTAALKMAGGDRFDPFAQRLNGRRTRVEIARTNRGLQLGARYNLAT